MFEPAVTHMFVHADGVLAESLCQVELLGLTARRAEQLRLLHRGHEPDACAVLAASILAAP
ncbi:hypothetical protein [Nocardia sp. NBC_00511]|uniref:hypothetical protein n=1 Tax=Nocardia sp. NBC_00511 TaxID=2903591 RepID=UPI0030E3AE63